MIERRACKRILDQLGVYSIKLTTPGQSGFPDRLFLIPGGRPFFIEFKRPGEEPRPLQHHIHQLLRQLGYDVEVHDAIEPAFAAVSKRLDAARIPANKRKIPA